MTRASVDITIPVLNEERTIENSLGTLATFLSTECPYDWCITVVDNGSKDRTWSLADAFAATNSGIRLIRLEQPGRGGALKAAWSTSTADVVAYMDVDLSTGLEALRPLLDPLVLGEADLSIGSRLASGAAIERSLQREVISRIYNLIARTFLGYSVRDAQCGFKAVRADVARDLLPRIEDNGWFFDTELLVLAWRAGLRLNEIPVRWIEDDDSRVHIVKTATDDLRGIWRLFRGKETPRRDHQGISGSSRLPASSASDQNGQAVDFDEFAGGYEQSVDRSVSFTGRDSAFYATRKVDILDEIARPDIGSLDAVSLLDVGCGTGTTDRFLRSRVRSLSGVDVSEEMLSKARSHVPDGEFTWYDGEKLPFPDRTFDVVVTICVLHHVPASSRFKFVNEMVRVARADGIVVVFEHNPFNPLTRHAVNSCELDRDAILLPPSETTSLLREASDAEPRVRHYLFSPLGGPLGTTIDRRLSRLPLGGQYVAWVRRPAESGL